VTKADVNTVIELAMEIACDGHVLIYVPSSELYIFPKYVSMF